MTESAAKFISPAYRRGWFVSDSLFVFLIFFVFFLFNLNSNFSGPHDSMGYLNDLERTRDLFPSHHLLYHSMAYGVLHLLALIFPNTQHYYLVEALDAFWGSLSLVAVFRIFSDRIRMSRIESFLGTAVAAFSFGLWFYSGNIEVYMPPLFFLLCCLYYCMKPNLERGDIVRLAILHALAVLFHQSNVLFTPIVLYKIWTSRRQLKFFSSALLYSLLSGSLVIVVFFIAGWWLDGHNNFADFYKWLRGYTLKSDYWFAPGLGTLLKALVGFGHAIFGGHFIFRVRFLESFMKKVFYYHSLDDEAFLVRNLSYNLALLLLVLTVLVAAVMGLLALRIILNVRKLYRTESRNLVPLLLFLLIYSVFFYFWMPENLEFWIPQATVFWILLLGMNKKLPPVKLIPRPVIMHSLLALLLFVINYFGTLRWMKDLNNDSVYVKISEVASLAGGHDVVILQDPWLLEDFLEHFTPAAIVKVPDNGDDIARTDSLVLQSLQAGGKIFLFTEGESLHSSRNRGYLDSLMSAHSANIRDLGNKLTPVKMISSGK